MSFIMDNLIAAKKARPMLVVMEQGYARGPARPPVARPATSGRPGPAPRRART